MTTLEETNLSVLRIFGREPSAVDFRCVGRWSYAAAWLAEDRGTARELVRARLVGAAGAATSAAMVAGRGDAERFALVSAIARLPEAFGSGSGMLGAAADRAIEEESWDLVADGKELRGATQRERAAFAPDFGLESFAAAMLDIGQDRHVLLRETASSLDEALAGARGPCPALRTLRVFLQATLAVDSGDVPTGADAPTLTGPDDTIGILAGWLTADLALAGRRAAAYEVAWSTVARSTGDSLSRAVAGLASGTTISKGIVDAFGNDPWGLILALAMTSHVEHASALLDYGAQAQAARRVEAREAIERWRAQAQVVADLEDRLGVAIVASAESREGFSNFESLGNLDLFGAWNVARIAETAHASLRDSTERSIVAETTRRRNEVQKSQDRLQATQVAYEAALEAAKAKATVSDQPDIAQTHAEESAQRGCVFGFGAGVSVILTYVVIAVIVGTDGTMGKIAPLVVGVAALPVAAAIVAHLAVSLRRAAATAEYGRRRAAATAEYERVRAAAERTHGAVLAQERTTLEEAEASLEALERKLAPELKMAA